jgi:alkanesulfonate monooxygenase SsuD/methylene tetrahydromethanopterin reductase-like flavin-dependent oxidoreductase (luciferase family)
VSGPQVVEGWYGQPFAKPISRTREYIDIVRQVLRREKPVTSAGPHYPLPYHGEGAWNLGKPLRSITHPLRADLPIYLGAEGPKNVALAAEIADGWLPLYYSPFRPEVYADSLGTTKPGFEIAVTTSVTITDDLAAGYAPHKASLGFYIGGMGAKDKNFHKELMGRMGFEAEAQKIQDLFFEGKRGEAIAAVPDEFCDEISLVGPPARIRERLAAWRESAVTTLLVPGTNLDDAARGRRAGARVVDEHRSDLPDHRDRQRPEPQSATGRRPPEELGYDHMIVYDHVLGAVHAGREPKLLGPYTERDAFHEPFVLLAYLARSRSASSSTTGVLILPQRQTALVAEAGVELDLLSRGRLRLGVGTGWNHVEYDSLGVPFAERGARPRRAGRRCCASSGARRDRLPRPSSTASIARDCCRNPRADPRSGSAASRRCRLRPRRAHAATASCSARRPPACSALLAMLARAADRSGPARTPTSGIDGRGRLLRSPRLVGEGDRAVARRGRHPRSSAARRWEHRVGAGRREARRYRGPRDYIAALETFARESERPRSRPRARAPRRTTRTAFSSPIRSSAPLRSSATSGCAWTPAISIRVPRLRSRAATSSSAWRPGRVDASTWRMRSTTTGGRPVTSRAAPSVNLRAAPKQNEPLISNTPTPGGIVACASALVRLGDLLVEHVAHRLDLGDLGHAPHEQERREHHADLDRQPVRFTATVSANVAISTSTSLRGCAQQAHEHVPLAHVVGDYEQDARERRHRIQPPTARPRPGSRAARARAPSPRPACARRCGRW